MNPATSEVACRSDDLLRILSHYDSINVVMHDNPDPDAIATGWGLLTLIEQTLRKSVRLIGGGAIVRAENRHLVDLLMPPVQLVNALESDSSAVVLVDCGLGTSNHLVERQGLHPVAVIDHHANGQSSSEVPFMDVRPDVAASTTIAADYLRQQTIEPGVRLATAMLYAIRTETCGFETHYTDLDRAVVRWLTYWADPALLAQIESAPLSRDYFADLALALVSTMIYDDVAFCLLPQAEGAEIVGEMADLLVRCRGVQRVLSGAVVEGDLIISVRTERDSDHAAELVQTLLDGLGSGGGHDHRAGGKIRHVGHGGIDEALKQELEQRWLSACGIEDRGQPLVVRKTKDHADQVAR